MTDNEIIKALEEFLYTLEDGYTTAIEFGGKRDEQIEKEIYLLRDALSLINRQKAEKAALIEHLKKARKQIKFANAEIERYRAAMPDLEQKDEDFCGVVCRFAEGLIKKAKAEAIKSFAERVKKHKVMLFNEIYSVKGFADVIDNLVEEMVGDG